MIQINDYPIRTFKALYSIQWNLISGSEIHSIVSRFPASGFPFSLNALLQSTRASKCILFCYFRTFRTKSPATRKLTKDRGMTDSVFYIYVACRPLVLYRTLYIYIMLSLSVKTYLTLLYQLKRIRVFHSFLRYFHNYI